jgi:chromosome segregation ATPase
METRGTHDKILASRVKNLENRINNLEAELEELRRKIEFNEENKTEENVIGNTELKNQALTNRKNNKTIQSVVSLYIPFALSPDRCYLQYSGLVFHAQMIDSLKGETGRLHSSSIKAATQPPRATLHFVI